MISHYSPASTSSNRDIILRKRRATSKMWSDPAHLLVVIFISQCFALCEADKIDGTFFKAIDEIFETQDLEARLGSTMQYCSETTYTHHFLLGGAEPGGLHQSTDRKACESALYTQKVVSVYNELKLRLENIMEGNSPTFNAELGNSSTFTSRLQPQPNTILTGDITNISFQTFVMDYEVTNTPLHLETSFDSGLELQEWRQCADSVLSSLDTPPHYIEIELRKECPRILDALRIPKYVVNDYFQRVPESMKEPLIWPTLVVVQAKEIYPLHRCSYHGNMMLVQLAGQTVVSRIPSSQLHLLAPEKGFDLNFVRDTIFEEGDQHLQNLNVFDSSTDFASSYPWFVGATVDKATIRVGDLLFLPQGSAVSFLGVDMPSSPEVSSDGTSFLLKFCYTDASNLKAAKRALRRKALVAESLRPMLRELESLTFDTTMLRNPIDVTFALYRNGIRDNEDQKSVVPSRGKARFKEWQEENKWKWRITELTLASPLPPTILALGRRNVTMQWTEPFKKRDDDTSRFGYRIGIYERATTDDGKYADNAKYVDVPSDEIRKVIPDFSAEDECLIEYTVSTLEPSTIYTFSVAVFLGEYYGHESARSIAITTSALTVPSAPTNCRAGEPGVHSVRVSWDAPIDDGGLPITHFLLFRREVEPITRGYMETGRNYHFDYAIKYSPSETEATVLNLLPNTAYEFRVAATNKLGPGEFSITSAAVRTLEAGKEDEELLVVGGSGHETYDRHLEDYSPHDARNGVRRRLASSVAGLVGPLVTLSDRRQLLEITISFETRTIDAWTAHFSPALFDATAELAYADPPDARTQLSNEMIVRDRVVLVERGEVPLVTKAKHVQLAGGVGIIVIDNGRCTNGFDQHCVPGADKRHGELFAAQDFPGVWGGLKIPMVLITQSDGEYLKSVLKPAHFN